MRKIVRRLAAVVVVAYLVYLGLLLRDTWAECHRAGKIRESREHNQKQFEQIKGRHEHAKK
jgi:hypothetical protein